MSHEVCVYKENYWIKRYSEDDEAIKITKEQYEGLERALLDTQAKFVKIGDMIIAVNSIKEVVKIAQKPNTDIFAETGSNPYYREWCAGNRKYQFKQWVTQNYAN